MTAPANKRRIHNDDARAAALRMQPGTSDRARTTRRSPYGRRLARLRKGHDGDPVGADHTPSAAPDPQP